LLELAARTADLSTRIDSRLAVLVRLERSRLTNLLKSRSVVLPDFATVAAQCRTGIARLASKVAVLEQMDLVLGRLGKKLALGVPPSQVDEINTSLQDVTVLIGKGEVTDAEIQAAAGAVAIAAAQVDKLSQPNDEFGRDLAERIHALIQDLDQTVATSPTYQGLLAAVPGPNRILRAVAPNVQLIGPDKYVEVDSAVHKMTLIREYVLLTDGTSNADLHSRLQERTDRLIQFVQTQSWEGLRCARLLLREMKDDVYPERLLELLKVPTEVFIEMDPPIAYERAPLEFAVRFRKPVFDTAAARDELSVEWDFGDGLTGKGWVVSHYFQFKKKQDTYEVQARIYYSTGDVKTETQREPIDLVPRTVKVIRSELGGRVGERTLAEALKLFAALLIAVFGLVSGAQDQISKLDILPGLVAVFLVGFSADSIKRLLTTNAEQ